jgi:hypothetical protein
LAINPFWHPPRDTSERCSVCKRDCSERAWRTSQSEGSTTFGQLLKGAVTNPKK